MLVKGRQVDVHVEREMFPIVEDVKVSPLSRKELGAKFRNEVAA